MRSGNKNITTVWIVQPKSKFNLKSNTDPESISEAIALTKALPSSKILGTTIVKIEKLNPKEFLFISDLDGTLLEPEGKFPQDSIDRLNRLIDIGLNFSIATARNHDSAYQILNKLNIKLPVILFNVTAPLETVPESYSNP